jgi:hypothetical protein
VVNLVFGVILWWLLIASLAVFVVLALESWWRARCQGRKWPWDE